jgi:septum formation topological specificity factor MinE
LSTAQKKKQVDYSGDYLDLLRGHSLAVLNNIVSMDESAVSFHTLETKKQSMQWVEKTSQDPKSQSPCK